jgi:ABC-type Mn2+/Zn2+ transport system ATPase subunit
VDIHSAADMVRLLAQTRDVGKTIFLVTHQAALLDGAADEFVWMKDGLIIGRTRDLKPPEGAK